MLLSLSKVDSINISLWSRQKNVSLSSNSVWCHPPPPQEKKKKIPVTGAQLSLCNPDIFLRVTHNCAQDRDVDVLTNVCFKSIYSFVLEGQLMFWTGKEDFL